MIQVLKGIITIGTVFGFSYIPVFSQAPAMIAEINPSGDATPFEFTQFDGDLYFSADDGNGRELWKYDGSNVSLAADINPTGGSDPNEFVVLGANLYFFADDGVNGTELWRYDGNTATLVADINPSGGSTPSSLTTVGTELFFSANDGTNGAELWNYDGASAVMVANIRPSGASSYPHELTVYGSDLIFVANDGSNGRELWVYDGIAASLIADINPSGFSDPFDLTVWNSEVYFQADDGSTGAELWKYDGSIVSQVVDINPTGDAFPLEFTPAGTDLYFSANDGVNGIELWRYDGATHTMIADINPSGSAFPNNLTVWGTDLYFEADNGTNGTDLWKTDGSIVTPLCDIHPLGGAGMDNLTVSGTVLYFSADNGSNGDELWVYDGMSCSMVADIYQGLGGSNPYQLTHWGQDIYFGADSNANGFELWGLLDCSNTTGLLSPTVCDSFVSPSGNHTWTSSGSYEDTVPNAAGCDSIITVNLNVLSSTSGSMAVSQCYQFESPSGNYTWMNSGIYSDTITNAVGCDSVITVNLTIEDSTVNTISPVACDSFVSPSGQYVWNSSGSYTDNLTNMAGCDSIITINLTIPIIDTSVTNSYPTLMANNSGATYQWVYCDSSSVPGEMGQSFTPTADGNYAVVLSENGCVDTSSCYVVNGTGIPKVENNSISVYPNPVNTNLHIKNAHGSYLLCDIFGRRIRTIRLTESPELIKVGNLAPGVYILKSIEGGRTIKFVRND